MEFRASHSHKGMLVEPHHEHLYKVKLMMDGNLNEEGFVVDFRAVKRLFRRVVGSQLDGQDLDTHFEYPTAENLAKYVWQKMAPFFPLIEVEVKEKPHSSAFYRENPCQIKLPQ